MANTPHLPNQAPAPRAGALTSVWQAVTQRKPQPLLVTCPRGHEQWTELASDKPCEICGEALPSAPTPAPYM